MEINPTTSPKKKTHKRIFVIMIALFEPPKLSFGLQFLASGID